MCVLIATRQRSQYQLHSADWCSTTPEGTSLQPSSSSDSLSRHGGWQTDRQSVGQSESQSVSSGPDCHEVCLPVWLAVCCLSVFPPLPPSLPSSGVRALASSFPASLRVGVGSTPAFQNHVGHSRWSPPPRRSLGRSPGPGP